jgi:hypothetical protein
VSLAINEQLKLALATAQAIGASVKFVAEKMEKVKMLEENYEHLALTGSSSVIYPPNL